MSCGRMSRDCATALAGGLGSGGVTRHGLPCSTAPLAPPLLYQWSTAVGERGFLAFSGLGLAVACLQERLVVLIMILAFQGRVSFGSRLSLL